MSDVVIQPAGNSGIPCKECIDEFFLFKGRLFIQVYSNATSEWHHYEVGTDQELTQLAEKDSVQPVNVTITYTLK